MHRGDRAHSGVGGGAFRGRARAEARRPGDHHRQEPGRRRLPPLLSELAVQGGSGVARQVVLPQGVPLQGAVADTVVGPAEAAKPLRPRGDPLSGWARARSSPITPRTVVQALSRTAARCRLVLPEMKDRTIAVIAGTCPRRPGDWAFLVILTEATLSDARSFHSSWSTADLWSRSVQKGFNRMSTLLVTGSSGLIGSEVVDYFCQRGWEVHGIDNNMRADFFGPQGDTRGNQQRLVSAHAGFHHHEVDLPDRNAITSSL